MGLFVWDSEPSKIFVGDTSISKVFLWDTQVRPSGYTYSYDFTSWSIADLTSQWWTIPATCSIDSWWITSSWWWTELYLDNITALYDAIQVANTVDIELVWTKASSWWEHAFNLRGAGNAEPVVMYWNGRYVEFKAWSKLYWANRTTLSAGTYTMTLSIDLANQSATYTDSWWNFSWTASISSSDVTSIRVINKLFLVCQKNVHIKSISIIVS